MLQRGCDRSRPCLPTEPYVTAKLLLLASSHPPAIVLQAAPELRWPGRASGDLARQDVGGDLDAQVGHVGLAEGRRRQLHAPPRRIRKLHRTSPR